MRHVSFALTHHADGYPGQTVTHTQRHLCILACTYDVFPTNPPFHAISPSSDLYGFVRSYELRDVHFATYSMWEVWAYSRDNNSDRFRFGIPRCVVTIILGLLYRTHATAGPSHPPLDLTATAFSPHLDPRYHCLRTVEIPPFTLPHLVLRMGRFWIVGRRHGV